ncbi:protein senC [Antarctobacter heliothermus]|uniref:Protein senC n=1 Tax=Antarctobacter heliothermus TaxID=74033 RepID=A0A222E0E7_9RHOB|nr:SCO family protein [Antarctobacter heliothermus]ASP19687.1 protein senC [Antarctobacter heliothermus]|mmetsp:Transcript_55304/g.175883  ORF Transcript_55304/g.175883 Transcript_55304/m.175883 type:complete len:208 (-) Transcript_55304:542-1165(-)
MQRLAAIASFAALVAISGGVWYATQRTGSDDPYAQCRTSKVAGGSEQIGGSFNLLNKAGEAVTDKDVITKPSLVYFGYTFCPDVCPFDVARNADAVDELDARNYDVTPVFISIDPERDTPEVVGEFSELIHERMIGLTGTPKQVKAASQAYRTYYRKQENGDPDYYLVDHSTFTYLVLPEAGFVDFFRREVTPEEMADRVACYIDAS